MFDPFIVPSLCFSRDQCNLFHLPIMFYHCYVVMFGILSCHLFQKELLTQNETYSVRFLRLFLLFLVTVAILDS